MTIFRGEMGGWFLVMFICLLVGKVWGWIGEGRIEFLEQQPPSNPRLFHTRLAASLLLSVAFNAYLLEYCVTTVLEQARPDMMVMFGFEFAILTILSTSTAARYTIALVEVYINHKQTRAKLQESRAEIRRAREGAIRQHQESGENGLPPNLPDENDVNEMELDIPGWEQKGLWVLYLDLATDFLKLVVYLSFFAILFIFYGLPIHILRDVVVTIRSFCRRIIDFHRYRVATRDMNDRYPDATVEEVTREEVCIICREEMTSWQQPAGANGAAAARARSSERLRPKKLPCGHILHFACLRSWLERQQNCPTCRRPVVVPPRGHGLPGDGQGQGFPGAQPNIPVGNQPPGQNGAQPDGMPRARVYQFGPFRIGFGAGRADLFQNMHHQIHHGNAPQLQQAGNVNPPGARQIGFGFGFGRPPPAPAPTPMPHVSSAQIQNHLQHIEHHIRHEINSLRVTAEQLHLVQHLQAEMERLRNLQAGSPHSHGPMHQTAPSNYTAPMPQAVPLPQTTPASFPPSAVAMPRRFMPDPNLSALRSGDARLPDGLTLPPGWTLTPLRSAEHASGHPPGSIPMPTAAQSSQSAPDAAVPQEASATANAPTEGQEQSREVNNTLTSTTTDILPNWQAEPAARTPGQHTELASQDWTDVTAEGPSEKTDASTAFGAVNEDNAQNTLTEGESSSSHGKSRAATVEDAVDEGT